MERKGQASSSTLDHGDENLSQELRRFLEIIEESRHSGHGFSVNLVIRSVSIIDDFKRQTMELRHDAASWPVIEEDKFLSSLTNGFLELSFEIEDFLKTVLTNVKNLNEELDGLLAALLQWKPSGHREEEKEIIVLDKLWRFGCSERFSEGLLESFCGWLKHHDNMVKQKGASLERKFRRLKWLKKAISTIYAGFVIVASVCSIIAAALHVGPVFASVVAAATSAVSWQPLALWVDKLWMVKLNELQQGKDLCTMLEPMEFNKAYALRDLQTMYSSVYQLKEVLENMHSSEELLHMVQIKESLQNKHPEDETNRPQFGTAVRGQIEQTSGSTYEVWRGNFETEASKHHGYEKRAIRKRVGGGCTN
ncbi:hypothetical protein EJ110_NYTH36563 [Nymphaea thermarum]|nr:hypothetical protein EJ110_NYTH36563 [Nymphaea thermarum]